MPYRPAQRQALHGVDCNTIFDAMMHRHCPTCGSAEFYPLESWLNRDRPQRQQPNLRDMRTAALAAIAARPRPAWLDRLYVPRVESESEMAGVSTRSRRAAVRRRAS